MLSRRGFMAMLAGLSVIGPKIAAARVQKRAGGFVLRQPAASNLITITCTGGGSLFPRLAGRSAQQTESEVA